MKNLLLKQKVSTALPILLIVAEKYGLKLNRAKEMKMALELANHEYKITSIK